MTHAWLLGQRALREMLRAPGALVARLFIPLFLLVVSVGQAGRIFPAASTSFLRGQSYAAFQIPNSLLLAASAGSAALFMIEDIQGGYFDKLRAAPISRAAIVLGRLTGEAATGVLVATVIVLLALPFGITVTSGPLGFAFLIALVALWSVAFTGFGLLIALKTRSAAATGTAGLLLYPLLFLTPNYVPRALLTRPMQAVAAFNPVTYLIEALRAIILQPFTWALVLRGFAIVALLGALMVTLNVWQIRRYD